MSLKQEIETWVQALVQYDNEEYAESLKTFSNVSDTSKIHFNCGVINATLGDHEDAIQCYHRAIHLDAYLAVAYFQRGVSYFLLGKFEEALVNFNETLDCLRGNTFIDYQQLGLEFRLYSCEVVFNRGLCYIYLQKTDAGMQDFAVAAREKVTSDHEVIETAISEKGENYTVFSIPVNRVYRPNQAKVKNLKTKDYLGKARLVAASDRSNAFTGFAGSEKRTMAIEARVTDGRPTENTSYAASNLVQPGLTSRGGRDQSAPPAMNGNVLPPTPPPDNDKPFGASNSGGNGMTGRAAAVRSPANRPPALQRSATGLSPQNDPLSRQSADRTSPSYSNNLGKMVSPRARPGSRRTASENRGGEGRRPKENRLYGEVPDDSMTDFYDMYQIPAAPRAPNRRGTEKRLRRRPTYIDEEDEYVSDDYEDDEFSDGEFEMVGGAGSRPKTPSARRPSTYRKAGGRRPEEVRQIRVKVHFNDETRYMMIGPAVEYEDLESRLREKFNLRKRPKIRIEDDGDVITMRDQDDLEVLIASSKSTAKQENQDMGKMEIWIE